MYRTVVLSSWQRGNRRKSKKNGAGNETRTRDPNLGKVVLYQLSYSRYANPELYLHLIFCQELLAEKRHFFGI